MLKLIPPQAWRERIDGHLQGADCATTGGLVSAVMVEAPAEDGVRSCQMPNAINNAIKLAQVIDMPDEAVEIRSL